VVHEALQQQRKALIQKHLRAASRGSAHVLDATVGHLRGRPDR
jgi:hypothetical protein